MICHVNAWATGYFDDDENWSMIVIIGAIYMSFRYFLCINSINSFFRQYMS